MAVPLDEACQPQTDETFPLHVYFPTEEAPGLHVIVHAEWVLGMDRRQLAATPEARPYNQMLLAHVVEFLENRVAVDLVVRSRASAAAVAAVVPATKPPSAGAGAQLRQLWEEALKRTRFLPVVDGSLARPADVCLLPPRMPSLAQAHALAVLDGSRTLRPDIEELAAAKKFLMSGSVARVMGVDEFLAHLKPPSHDSISDYYRFLLNWRDQIGQQLVATLRMKSRVLTTSGQLVTPAGQPVFFPRGRSDSSIPEDMPVPIAEVPPIEGVEAFLKDLGVRPFEWRDLIRDFLVRILADPKADPEERHRAMFGLRAYHQVRQSGNEELAPVLGRVLLLVRSADGTRRELRAAAEVYFGADWTRSNDLEVLYGPFGRAEFLDVEVAQDSDCRQVDISFYRMLGVADHPRLDEAKPADPYGYMVGHYRHPHRGPLFDEWMTQPHVREAAQCPQGHPQSQQLRLSYQLDRHLDLIESRDEHRLFALWRQFATRWGATYEPAMEAIFRCVHGSHSGDRNRTCESLFAYTLRSRPWVPVARGPNTDVVRPEDAWVDATDAPRRIKDRIPRISGTMYQMHGGAALVAALGLTDAGRPKVKDLLALLNSIAAEADELGETNREIELAARYVQRTLDDVLDGEPKPHPAPETVRVLASHNGRSTFVAQPLVADDPLLRDTWERKFPVLSAEARLNRLVRYLSLTKLDNVVTASAMPYGHHLYDAPSTAVHSLLDDVKPYLLALVRAESLRAESMARNALKRLELVICDSLVLRYEYDGVTVERDDAVCYIATRPERGGRTNQIGTAYLELDPTTGAPHWFPFGRQLAQHLGTPALADAVTMLLTAKADDRQRMMTDRQIRPKDITEAREQLGLTADDDEPGNILDSLLSQVDRQASTPPVNATTAPASAPMSPPPSSTPAAAKPTGTPQHSLATTPPATVDYSKVRIVDGQLGEFLPPTGGNSQSWAGGEISTAPSVQSEAEKRQIGKRGEEVVFHKERERLREAGKNPDLVVWVSNDDELSPFDIQSVDADDQLIYIEVKSTKADNPDEPFYLSQAELLEASLHGSRYYIYRVTNAVAEAPTITRVADPLRKVKEGRGRLLLDRARMTLALSKTSE
ncbi:DUF3883 domain-containing protein [Micromonospora cremea]|uniref:Protein NO VEIN C-terminal domain-containing protein n=1 Tax=Micromonospora cremea TaxID=709881 RepID=A0A1N5TZS5_9ACTN|nr:DUF3883 domain-containing protein [Micromonospora cremea]SIM53686.1 protein of unknown function [Micromonospora cremea]